MGPTANARPGCDGDYTVHISSASILTGSFICSICGGSKPISHARWYNTVVGQPRTLTGRK